MNRVHNGGPYMWKHGIIAKSVEGAGYYWVGATMLNPQRNSVTLDS